MVDHQKTMDANAMGVYVHWPYCARICPYCDFNVYKDRNVDDEVWITAFTTELDYWAKLTQGKNRKQNQKQNQKQNRGRKLTSLYFGGGTPSLAPLSVLGAVIEACERLWGFEDEAEITLEVNPADIELSAYHEFSAIGINRFSLGVQSFDDGQLKFLGRDHNGVQAKKAIEAAQNQIGLVTFDLIYGLPSQSLEKFEQELKQAFALSTDHLSLYQLTIEQGTAFGLAQQRGALKMPDEDKLAEFYELAVAQCQQAGYAHYEISNFAKPHGEAVHNLLYWQHQDYIGIGPGAHGRVTLMPENLIPETLIPETLIPETLIPETLIPETLIKGNWDHKEKQRIATKTFLKPADYLKACAKSGHGLAEHEILSLEQQMQERFSMGLRLQKGIPLRQNDYLFNDGVRRKNLNMLIDQGYLEYKDQYLKASEDGRRLLDGIVQKLLF